MVAIRSAPTPCGTNEVSYAVSGSIAQAPPSEPIGTRDIDSTPPAQTRSSQPEATFCAAMLTASRPEAQKRFSCTPDTVFGSPALIAAALAMSPPWSPIGETQPRTTSSILPGSRSGLRLSISCINPTTRSMGLVAWSEPLTLPRPRGVLSASKMSGSVAAMGLLLLLQLHTVFGKRFECNVTPAARERYRELPALPRRRHNGAPRACSRPHSDRARARSCARDPSRHQGATNLRFGLSTGVPIEPGAAGASVEPAGERLPAGTDAGTTD